MNLSHAEAQALISARLDGPLDSVAERTLNAHLATCQSCRAFNASATGLAFDLREMLHHPPSPAVARAVLEHVNTPRSPLVRMLAPLSSNALPAFTAVAATLLFIVIGTFAALRYIALDDTEQIEAPTNQVVQTGNDVSQGTDATETPESAGQAPGTEPTGEEVAEPTTEPAATDPADTSDQSGAQPTSPATEPAVSEPGGAQPTAEPDAQTDEQNPTEPVSDPTATTAPAESAQTEPSQPDAVPTDESSDSDLSIASETEEAPASAEESSRPSLIGEQPSATAEPTTVPTEVPTEVPTPTPTTVPTEVPTPTPTPEPTATAIPTEEPTPSPTTVPTEIPTEVPTPTPTTVPTEVPTEVPTPTPTPEPTAIPTEVPTPTVEATAVATEQEPPPIEPRDPTVTPETGETDPADVEDGDDPTEAVDDVETGEAAPDEPTVTPEVSVDGQTIEPVDGGDPVEDEDTSESGDGDGTVAGDGDGDNSGQNDDDNSGPSDDDSTDPGGDGSDSTTDGPIIEPIDGTADDVETDPDAGEATAPPEEDQEGGDEDEPATDGQSLGNAPLGPSDGAVPGDATDRIGLNADGDLITSPNPGRVALSQGGLSLEVGDRANGQSVLVCGDSGSCIDASGASANDAFTIDTPIGWLGEEAIYERIDESAENPIAFRAVSVDVGSGVILEDRLIAEGPRTWETVLRPYPADGALLVPAESVWLRISSGRVEELGENPYGRDLNLIRYSTQLNEIAYVGGGQMIVASLDSPGSPTTQFAFDGRDFDLSPDGQQIAISTGSDIRIVDRVGNVVTTLPNDEGIEIGSLVWLNEGIVFIDLTNGVTRRVQPGG